MSCAGSLALKRASMTDLIWEITMVRKVQLIRMGSGSSRDSNEARGCRSKYPTVGYKARQEYRFPLRCTNVQLETRRGWFLELFKGGGRECDNYHIYRLQPRGIEWGEV